jgi:hypothetical protein
MGTSPGFQADSCTYYLMVSLTSVSCPSNAFLQFLNTKKVGAMYVANKMQVMHWSLGALGARLEARRVESEGRCLADAGMDHCIGHQVTGGSGAMEPAALKACLDFLESAGVWLQHLVTDR